MKLYGREFSIEQLKMHIGDISQVMGIKRYKYTDGRAKGINAIEVKNGIGITFNVLEDRSLDICNFEYEGIPFGHICKSGIAAPWYYEPSGDGWLRTFNAGLLTTCGIVQAGPCCKYNGKELGLHGRISNTPAENVNVFTETADNELEFIIKGKVREACMENENLLLEREIISSTRENSVIINDKIKNDGYSRAPFMMLYHFNIGFPIFSEDSILTAPIKKTIPLDEMFPSSSGALACFNTFGPPDKNGQTQVFIHELSSQGNVAISLFNKVLNMGISIDYDTSQLGCLTQARILRATDYYCVIEPGTCYPLGRLEQEKQFGLEYIEPGETKKASLTLRVITGI
jgi:hypothetical protein